MTDDSGGWNDRFRTGEYPADPESSALLRASVDARPDGRAMDVATGTGRNATFLASEGYSVDGVDRRGCLDDPLDRIAGLFVVLDLDAVRVDD